MRIHGKNILIVLSTVVMVVTFGLSILQAESNRFTASANRNVVGVNQNLKVSFKLKDAKGNNFQPPDFKYFRVVGGPNQSTSMRIVNGNVSRSITYSYYLQPKREGKFSIGSASIQVDGETLRTNSLNITVKKGGRGQSRNNQQKKKQSIEEKIEDNLFLKLYVNDTEVYQGEQITATYKLYTRFQIGRTRLSETPSFTGFWSEDIQQPKNLEFKRESYQEKQFKTAALSSVALFPQRTGTLELDPMKLETRVRVPVKKRRRSVFDKFFGSYKDVKYEFKSNRVKVNVKPLPPNKPKSFSGAVGDFNYDVTLDRKTTEVDEPITISVRISGQGNLKLMDAPKLDLPSEFEVYDPKINANVSNNGGKIHGSKTYDFLVVPRNSGEYKLPSLTFSYFDTKEETYKTVQSPEHMITVTGQPKASSSDGGGNGGNVSKDEVELIGKDIRYIKTGNVNLRPKGYFLPASISFFGLYAAPVLLFVLAFLYREKRHREGQDTTGQRQKRAKKVAYKRLAKAKQLIHKNEDQPFYDEVVRSIWDYLSDRLTIEKAQLTRDKVEQVLLDKHMPQEHIDELKQVLNDCEMALFAPSAATTNKEQIYTRATDLITTLEEQLT
jgi:hypothetical protein